jgi:hypothetical protein
MSVRIVFGVGLAVLLVSISSTTAQTEAGPRAATPPAPLSFSAGKVCSAAVGGVFRDTVNVPDTYKIADCEALAKKLALSVARRSYRFTYGVGCLTANGYTWSETPGQPPDPNPCNW